MNDDQWMTIQAAAELSGYHPTYLRLLVREGRVPARKFGPLWQVSWKGLQEYIKEAERSEDKRRGPKP